MKQQARWISPVLLAIECATCRTPVGSPAAIVGEPRHYTLADLLRHVGQHAILEHKRTHSTHCAGRSLRVAKISLL